MAREPLPSFVVFLGFLAPLASTALGFDAVNREHPRPQITGLIAAVIVAFTAAYVLFQRQEIRA